MTTFDKLLNAGIINPLDLDVNIFNNLQEVLSQHAYKKFIQTSEAQWLSETYFMEVSAGIVYQHLSDQIKFSKEFSKEDIEYIHQYLSQTAKEEKAHADSLRQMIHNIIGENPEEHYLNPKTIKEVLAIYKEKSFCQIMIEYYIHETALLSSFRLLFKHTTNKTKKQLLQQLLVDEANHHNIVLSIIDKLLHYVDNNEKENLLELFLVQSAIVSKFQFIFFKNYFKTSSKNELFFEKAYADQFNKSYSESLDIKLFKCIKKINSQITFENFVKDVDDRARNMLYL